MDDTAAMATRVPVFDLDGTLLDSDEALVAPFVALGVDRVGGQLRPRARATSAPAWASRSADYLDAYDDDRAQPFAGRGRAGGGARTGGRSARTSTPRRATPSWPGSGWEPEVALFSDAFDGPKRLEPVLDALGLDAATIVFVGDTAHDRACAAEVGRPLRPGRLEPPGRGRRPATWCWPARRTCCAVLDD